jgi:DNA-binding transcriptional regulator YiaG
MVKSGPKLNLAQQIPLPCGFSLRVLADSIPGGLEVMLALGWLSGDAQARAVRDRWQSLPRQAKRGIGVEDVCRAVGIDVGEYFGIVAATAFDLGMDVSTFIGCVERMNARVVGCAQRVITGARQSKPLFGALRPEKIGVECDAMAAFRRKWKLSEQQFSRVLGCGLRSVKRWESGECTPQLHQRWVLELLRRYASRNGIAAFRRRFVGESPRYQKSGRPIFKVASG